jgi:hypothetical protein
MKPGFHLWTLKPKSSQISGCTHVHQTSWKSLNKCCLPESCWQLFFGTGQERSADGGIHAARGHINVRHVLHVNWELFDHIPYGSDLALRDCHLNNCLGWQHFNSNEELMESVKTWLSSQVTDFFDTGMQKLVPNMTSASILAVTSLRSSLSMFVFLYKIIFFISC